jgi:hypothetical protein
MEDSLGERRQRKHQGCVGRPRGFAQERTETSWGKHGLDEEGLVGSNESRKKNSRRQHKDSEVALAVGRSVRCVV